MPLSIRLFRSPDLEMASKTNNYNQVQFSRPPVSSLVCPFLLEEGVNKMNIPILSSLIGQLDHTCWRDKIFWKAYDFLNLGVLS